MVYECNICIESNQELLKNKMEKVLSTKKNTKLFKKNIGTYVTEFCRKLLKRCLWK